MFNSFLVRHSCTTSFILHSDVWYSTVIGLAAFVFTFTTYSKCCFFSQGLVKFLLKPTVAYTAGFLRLAISVFEQFGTHFTRVTNVQISIAWTLLFAQMHSNIIIITVLLLSLYYYHWAKYPRETRKKSFSHCSDTALTPIHRQNWPPYWKQNEKHEDTV